MKLNVFDITSFILLKDMNYYNSFSKPEILILPRCSSRIFFSGNKFIHNSRQTSILCHHWTCSKNTEEFFLEVAISFFICDKTSNSHHFRSGHLDKQEFFKQMKLNCDKFVPNFCDAMTVPSFWLVVYSYVC